MFDQKSGEMVRKQVNLRDAHKVAVDLLDKRAMLDKAAAPQQEEKQDEDRLLKLAEKFAEFVTKKKDPLIIDAEDVEIKTRDNSEAEGQSHKLEVVGSSPAPATKDIEYAYQRALGEDESRTEGSVQTTYESLETTESRQMEPLSKDQIS